MRGNNIKYVDKQRVMLGVKIHPDLKSQLPKLAQILGHENTSRLVESLLEQAAAAMAETHGQSGTGAGNKSVG